MCDRFGHGREVASPDRSRVSPAGRGLRGCPVGPGHGVPVSIVAIPFDNVGQDLVGVLNQLELLCGRIHVVGVLVGMVLQGLKSSNIAK